MDQITELSLESTLGAFEPLQRPRSNTWPLPRPENKDEMDMDKNGCPEQGMAGGVSPPQGNLPQKKNSSRRNAWGNMSYADLITRAINSSPDKRLTLSQIYDWMVQNVPYFKNKGDSNSSAGWKNSIRHNLSLHNRFMRVQNEGAGKSSWWMINQDAPAGKAARRRAASMETQKFEKKRGRVKKLIESMNSAGLPPDTTPSPSSSVSEGLDMFPDSPVLNNNQSAAFQLSPDFRPRASSNASSCSRLSPISALEQDNQVPPSSPISWNSDMVSMYSVTNAPPPAYPSDLDNLKLCDSITESMVLNDPLPMKQNSNGYTSFYNTPVYTELSPVRSMSLDKVPILNRVKLEPRDLYCNGGLSAGVKPPPTIPESQEPIMSCSSPGLRSLEPMNNIHISQMIKQEPSVSHLRGHLSTSDCADLNIDVLDTLHGGLECDVDQVIKHELSVDGSLDFNFTDSVPSDSNQVHLQTPQGSHSWVH